MHGNLCQNQLKSILYLFGVHNRPLTHCHWLLFPLHSPLSISRTFANCEFFRRIIISGALTICDWLLAQIAWSHFFRSLLLLVWWFEFPIMAPIFKLHASNLYFKLWVGVARNVRIVIVFNWIIWISSKNGWHICVSILEIRFSMLSTLIHSCNCILIAFDMRILITIDVILDMADQISVDRIIYVPWDCLTNMEFRVFFSCSLETSLKPNNYH